MGAAAAAALCGVEATQRTAALLRPLLRWLRALRGVRGGAAATPVELDADDRAPRAGRTPRAEANASAEQATPRTDPDVRPPFTHPAHGSLQLAASDVPFASPCCIAYCRYSARWCARAWR